MFNVRSKSYCDNIWILVCKLSFIKTHFGNTNVLEISYKHVEVRYKYILDVIT